MNERILYYPRSGSEMIKATCNTPIIMYSDICKKAKKYGVVPVINQMFKKSPQWLILLQDPHNLHSGHWFSLSIHPENHSIYYFSTYGFKPDVEKHRWISDRKQRESNQDVDILNDGLQTLQRTKGWRIHYNDHSFQKEGDKTATCGIFTAAFLRSGLNPDEFVKQTQEIESRGENSAVYYYQQYFL